jgi:UDP-galactopyranose mutase
MPYLTIVKNAEGERFQLPMSGDYMNVLLGSKGTKDYVQELALQGYQGKKLQTLKSLGIREAKKENSAISDKLYKDWNTMQANKAYEIDPALVNDYRYVRNEAGELLYMPKSYADFLQAHGYVTPDKAKAPNPQNILKR